MDLAPTLDDDKRALRQQLLRRRRDLSAAEAQTRSAAAADRLTGLPEFADAGVVSGYIAVRGEADPAAALAVARRAGKRVVLPRVSAAGEGGPQGPRLRFHEPRSDAELRPAAFGLVEPDPACPEVSPEVIDLLVVPGVAFDAEGRRLGQGGGYYDEVAAALRAAASPGRRRGLLVGFGFDFQVIDRVPAGPMDQPVDVVVTDARALRPPSGAGAASGERR